MRPYEIKVEEFSYNPPNSLKGVLHNISFEVRAGEFVSLVGRNGQGKTSIIQAIAGELDTQYTTGKIQVGTTTVTRPINQIIKGVGVVHQFVQDDLIPELSIANNIKLRQLFGNNGKYKHSNKNSEWNAHTNQQLADKVGDKDFKVDLSTLVKTLSGGQRQLLNVLMALDFEHSNYGCQLLLLDEPLTGLDIWIQKQVVKLIDELTINSSTEERATTIVMVTHDLQLALNFSDKVFIVNDGKVSEFVTKGSENWKVEHLEKALL